MPPVSQDSFEDLFEDLNPSLRTEVPGPKSRRCIDRLARTECPAITARRSRRAVSLGVADDDPIVWAEAVGANVIDVDGNRFVDMTAGFGVATLGHRHPDVVRATADQSTRLLHAMGDAYPDATRIDLLDGLIDAAPDNMSAAILGLSGADAVDATVKTAILATGRTGVLAFRGGYHGLSLGAVPLQGYKSAFADPFRDILHPHVHHLPYGAAIADVEAVLAGGDVGMVLVEPIQARGGVRVPPTGWLPALREAAHKHGAILALDEIYTGFARTGTAFACQYDDVQADLMCVGKALGGGFPISACLGTRQVMDAWGASKGEAIHTQTFLGHPVGCAAGLVTLKLLPQTAARATRVGEQLRTSLEQAGFGVRGRGLLLGVELDTRSLTVSRALMRRGWIALPAGMHAEVLSLSPPVCLSTNQIKAFVTALTEVCA
ncbi:MAG: 4-aminobutyrate aminotransferase/(S)-3-amino-2-methylpropionate transaminase [Kiritimatiellia bacterium]|jgi:4-aminobutyrate aminotransferase/(S)-3-amino-2-methylpropionate transaminase